MTTGSTKHLRRTARETGGEKPKQRKELNRGGRQEERQTQRQLQGTKH